MEKNSSNNFRTMDKKTREIAFQYKKMKIHVQNDCFARFNETSACNNGNYTQYIECVDLALNALDKEERIIIENDYFKGDDYIFWWLSFYSRSSYYRKKKTALIKFLDLLSI